MDRIIDSDRKLIVQIDKDIERTQGRIKKRDNELKVIGENIAGKKGQIAKIEGQIEELKNEARATTFSRQTEREKLAYLSGQKEFAQQRLEEYQKSKT